MRLGEGVQYSATGAGSGSGQYGNHWVNPHQPRLVKDGVNMVMESGQRETVTFIKSGSGYVPEYFVRDTLSYDSVSKRYTVTSPSGEEKVFKQNGAIVSQKDAYGNVAKYNYAAGELTSVEVGTGSNAVGYYYTFDTFGRLESVVMRVGGFTPEFDYRRVTYHYTTAGDLELAAQEEKVSGEWLGVDISYYRYDSNRRLAFVLNDHAYHQMKGDNPSWPEAAPDNTLALYAVAQYGYYDGGLVKFAKSNGGEYTYEFNYTPSAHAGSGVNVWTWKTMVKRPDGSKWTYYYNRSFSLMLVKAVERQSDGSTKVWYPICQRFDVNSRLVLKASSAAVDVVDESNPILFTLKADTGMIQVFTYDAAGNKLVEGVKKGETGSVVKQREFTYEARTVSGVTIYVKKTAAVYRDATDTEASNPATTSFAYTWFKKGTKETFQIKTVATTLPAVPNSENGDNQPGTLVSTFDRYGFLIKQTDALGTKTKYSYDLQTGGLKQKIQDAGWNRTNLTTDYELDPMGRTVRTLGPVHEISLNGVATNIRRAQWIQYNDWADEVRTINGYVKVADSSEHTINPVRISKAFVLNPVERSGWRTEEIATVYDGAGVPPATEEFAQSAYVRWSMGFYDRRQIETDSHVYHLIPATGLGVSGTNYAQTKYGYDKAGRRNRVTSPEGTVNLTIYNARNWPLKERVGTTDANLVTTRVNEFDDGVAKGNGNLTKITLRVDGDTINDRVTLLRYDWRNRQVELEANDGTRTLIRQNILDNRGNTIRVDEYQNSASDANLINRADVFFDARNRRYRSKRYGVTVGTGVVGAALTGDAYYDQNGRVVRDQPAGKVGFTATRYDRLRRAVKQFRAFGGTLDYGDPGNVATATVVEQSEFSYNAARSVTAKVNRQRFDNAIGTGELKTPTTEPKARVSYFANYPDALGRVEAVANYGTNGGASWSRPAIPPARSDTVLVTTFNFDAAGDQTESVDPAGTKTKTEYDQLGRQVKTIEDFVVGGSGPDKNKTTRFEYNLDGNLKKLVAENSVIGDQVTEWIYGVTHAQGSNLDSKGLVYQKVYPDSTSGSDRMTHRYNRQGQAIRSADQAGTTHQFDFDRFGRLVEDAVTAFGANIDQTVKKVARSYEVRGMLEKITSLDGSNATLNEVQNTYNAFSQLAKDYQAHSGAVNAGSTLFVGYSYADGTANTVRRTGITYPNGNVVDIGYDGTAADALSRPDALKEGVTTLCSYRYLGSEVVIGVKYEAASNVELTYEDGGTVNGDPYTGLDRFGRLIETIWKKGSAIQEQSQYGRNRFGGVTWRRDDTAHAQGVTTEDNFYWYDGLYQVKERQRGDLTGTAPNYTGITNLQQEEDWTYDPTGNWDAYSNSAPSNSQTRTHNKVNEITQIAASAGNVSPTYDPVGNMRTLPKAPGASTSQYDLKWDAWNRLVEVKDGSTVVASYGYDGLFRRVTTTNASETRQYYYNDQWRAVEERVDGASVTVDRQYTWGVRDRWDLIRRKRSTSGSSLNETHFCLRDYLDPVAIVGTDGLVKERYAYDAFGNVRFLAPDYSSRSVSSFDWELLFHAEFRDAVTGLYNYGYRYYSTGLGRWLSRDPIGEREGPNVYASFRNCPLSSIDVFGMATTIGPDDSPATIYCNAAKSNPKNTWLECACEVSREINIFLTGLVFGGLLGNFLDEDANSEKAAAIAKWFRCIRSCILKKFLVFLKKYEGGSLSPEEEAKLTPEWDAACQKCLGPDGKPIEGVDNEKACCESMVNAEQTAIGDCEGECGKYPFKGNPPVPGFEGGFGNLQDRINHGIKRCCQNGK